MTDKLGYCGGLVVSALALYSDDPVQIPLKSTIYLKIMLISDLLWVVKSTEINYMHDLQTVAQRALLLLQRSEFESRWSLQFS